MHSLKTENKVLKGKIEHSDDWIKPTLKNLSSSAKKEFKNDVHMAKDEIEVGTLYRLRLNTGINFNKFPQISSIIEWTEKEDNFFCFG